jgi:23S rRNA pseudouridine2605 synthase
MLERLQKILAQAGYGSRRACEEFITAGRVRVNGQVAILGQKADASRDKITLDNKPLPAREKLTYIALYKPRNIISSVDDEVGRKTVRDLIPETGTLYPVGRLDWDSEGLMLMTNDGDLTNRLTHPRYGHEKEYKVLVARRPDPEQIETWRRGVVMEDGYKTAPADVFVESGAGKGAWIRVTMGEGRKRQIREIGALLGLPVVRIVRIRIGTLRLGAMKPGDFRHLTGAEVEALQGKKVGNFEQRPRIRKPLAHRSGPARRSHSSDGSKVNERKEKSKRESSRPTRTKK